MANIRIRNVDAHDLAAIDALAASRGMSRSELLRRAIHDLALRQGHERLSVEDLRRSLALSTDLLADNMMRGAWE